MHFFRNLFQPHADIVITGWLACDCLVLSGVAGQNLFGTVQVVNEVVQGVSPVRSCQLTVKGVGDG